ncbi:NAD(P)-dependent dehydrogenase (short-subunit alcohol dehydrogenase family) [Streptomyces aurantiacus]|uniref:SDR family NAD(P)-dependent oxidoreductase n=1 Tax=Streptomyces aurantiacus TaxID=47760 RepID=UPI002792B5F1|nr:SDR family NAD(P)-dependent oxidoreductase [Streptomyces aurantiacus]MDQ0773634.1 NAD(P)-dependent dehydrogenase (short-subunit alcohol dehydrogenase family) [Streptomyces aurantiacus]
MDLKLAGKRALVTGGSRGLGFAVAEELCGEGVRVALLARDAAAVESAAAGLRAAGHDAIGVVADTAQDRQVESAVAAATERFGGIDILVNGAAKAAGGPATGFLALHDDDLRSEMETKVLGYLRCARAVAPQMIESGWGRIINIGGLAMRRTGSVFGSVRNVAVAAMSKNLADELGPKGVNVTVVHPWVTETEGVRDMIRDRSAAQGITEAEFTQDLAADVSVGRLIQPSEVAHVVTFLASPLSVAINGEAVATGGGLSGPIFY